MSRFVRWVLFFFQKGYHSVLFKISVVYLLSAAIPLMILGVLYGGYLSNMAVNAYAQDINSQLILSNNRLEKILSEGLTISRTLATSPSIQNLLEYPLRTAEMVSALQYEILPILQANNAIQPIGNIKIIHGSSIVSNVYKRVIFDPQLFLEYYHMDGTLVLKESYKISVGYENNYFPTIPSSVEQQLIITRPILLSFGIRKTGFVVETYNLNSLLTEIFTQNYPADTVFYFTKGSEVLWSSNSLNNHIPGNNGIISVNGSNYYVSNIANNEFQYGLAVSVPLPNNLSTTFVPQFIIILILISAISVGILISSYILKRLKRADYALQQFTSGNYEFRLQNKGNDEVEVLFRTYNKMAERIQTLLINLKQAQDTEKIAIYKSLVNQIRPHFLNNALDELRMKAFAENLPDISKYLEEIINYLDYNIGNTNSYVTLDEEIRSVIDYISIYNLSKKDNIRLFTIFEQEVADSINKYKIPKFTIQPIVENSLRHGLLSDTNKSIFIKIKLQKESIIISVEDNGIGISKERLKEVHESLAHNIPLESLDNHSSVGLNNIFARLNFCYSGNVGFEIESFEGVGTILVITIPKEPPENGYFFGS